MVDDLITIESPSVAFAADLIARDFAGFDISFDLARGVAEKFGEFLYCEPVIHGEVSIKN